MSIKKDGVYCDVAEPLHLESYTPYFFTTIPNYWTATTSQKYLRDFDIGVNEWRVFAALSVFGQATSLSVAKLISIDRAAVSRAMRGTA